MRSAFLLFVITSTAVFAEGGPAAKSLLRDDVPQLETMITIRRIPEGYRFVRRPDANEGLFHYGAVLLEGEGENQRVLGKHEIVFGAEGRATSTKDFGPLKMELSVTVSPSANSAAATLVVKRNGQRVLKQVSRFALAETTTQPAR